MIFSLAAWPSCVFVCIYIYVYTITRSFIVNFWIQRNPLLETFCPTLFFPPRSSSRFRIYSRRIFGINLDVEMSEMSILASGERQDPGILWPAECKRHALKISRTTGAPVATLGGLTRPRNSGSHTFSSMRSLISREALRLTSLRLLVPQGPTLSLLAISLSTDL